jgi:hypothetical protein
MRDFITKQQLSKTAEIKSDTSGSFYKSIYVRLHNVTLDKTKVDSSVFLSHSHKDVKLVEDLALLLVSLGISVYVDWMDESMTYPPDGKTAVKIKSKIKENKKFILLATTNAIGSEWCNWELGLGDADKYINNIALIPIANNDGSWNGNEYLQIYPYIDKDYKSLEFDSSFTVVFPNGKKVKLIDWLKN